MGAGQSQGGAEAAEAQQEGFYAEMVDPGVSGYNEAFDGAQPGFSAAGVSPRKTLRKCAPRKRKKAAAASEAAAQLDPAGAICCLVVFAMLCQFALSSAILIAFICEVRLPISLEGSCEMPGIRGQVYM